MMCVTSQKYDFSWVLPLRSLVNNIPSWNPATAWENENENGDGNGMGWDGMGWGWV